jgi:hypothetical protein
VRESALVAAMFALAPTPSSEQQFVGFDEHAESGQRHKGHDERHAKRMFSNDDESLNTRTSQWILHPTYLFFSRAASMLKAAGLAAAR